MKFLLWAESQYARLRLLSIDVAFAGLGAGVMAAKLVGSHPRSAFYFVLPLSIWIVYTLDHLLDAKRTGPVAGNPRHRFHYRHATMLGIVVCTASALCLVVGWEELSWPSRAYCFAVGVLFIVHELLVSKVGSLRSPWLIKEFGVAFIFTAGTWGVPITRHVVEQRIFGGWPTLAALQYFLLAMVNLLEFSAFEARIDARDGQTSFVLAVGRRKAWKISAGLLLVQGPLAIAVWCQWPEPTVRVAEIIFAMMTCGLAVILRWPRVFARAERYRMLGDGVFLLPLLVAFARDFHP